MIYRFRARCSLLHQLLLLFLCPVLGYGFSIWGILAFTDSHESRWLILPLCVALSALLILRQVWCWMRNWHPPIWQDWLDGLRSYHDFAALDTQHVTQVVAWLIDGWGFAIQHQHGHDVLISHLGLARQCITIIHRPNGATMADAERALSNAVKYDCTVAWLVSTTTIATPLRIYATRHPVLLVVDGALLYEWLQGHEAAPTRSVAQADIVAAAHLVQERIA